MKATESTALGQQLAALLQAGETAQARALLSPILAGRTPFARLDRIGQALGGGSLAVVNPFLAQIASGRTMGGWAVIGSALGAQLQRDLAGALDRARAFIVAGDAWYAADILAERVPGPALVAHFPAALALLAPWREDANPWVRRAAGVAVHFWAKRSRAAAGCRAQAVALLAFLEPAFEERHPDAVKGIGWGLKTLGRYYPDLLADWLARERLAGRRPRALVLRKALTYLPAELRARARGATLP